MVNKKRRNTRKPRPVPSGGLAPGVAGGRPADTGLSAPEGGVAAPSVTPAATVATAPPRGPVRAPAPTATVTGPRRALPQAATIDIDARVPYFAADLRRIAVTATVMVLLIVGGSFLLR